MRISKQKKEEKRLRKEFQQVYGSDDLALEKQQQMNSLNDEINILQRQHQNLKSEEQDIRNYQERMGGDTEIAISIRETSKQI